MFNSTLNRGIVKQVLSGDSVIIRGQPKGGPPPERQLGLSNVTAPKLGRRPTAAIATETKDEPFAWESREFLRKKLIGKDIFFSVEYKAPGSGKDYGCIFLQNGDQLENITEASVLEGLVEVKRGGIKANDDQSKLIELEEQAKAGEKGKWSKDANEHVRNITWTFENTKNFADAHQGEKFDAIIEHVRDGCTVRAFLLPDFYHVTVMMAGIKTPMFKRDGTTEIPDPYAEEARFFTESRLLQKEVKIRLDGVSNANFLGTIFHPAGNIAEHLLREGFARCVDWSMSALTEGHDNLRSAERLAKQKRLRIWRDYQPSAPTVTIENKEFTGKVTEVFNADAMVVKTADGKSKKIFLSSLRAPRLPTKDDGAPEQNSGNKRTRPLYDVPYMFEGREFMRKKLIGKKVNVVIDYIKPPSDGFPEKTCATVTIGQINVGEALISKGLATVLRHRQDDDQRSACYDELLSAETRAAKNGKGVHSKKEAPTHRISEVSGDVSKAKQFLPFLQRAGRINGIVEFVASGSRLRVYLPKETCLITLLLGGIQCPRMKSTANQGYVINGEPYGETAYEFTRETCLQKDVEIEVTTCDRAGNFVGWLFIGETNLSLSLVQEGLSSVHFTADRSPFYNQLVAAEESAKNAKLNIWAAYEEPKIVEPVDDTMERQCKYEKVVVTEAESPLSFWAQHADSSREIEQMMETLRSSLAANPPVPGSFTARKGELCAALFHVDNTWYRAKILKVSSPKEICVLYIDFGNIELLPISKLRALPQECVSLKPQATEYSLAMIREPNDEELKYELSVAFRKKVVNNMFSLNKEHKLNNQDYVTLATLDNKEDIGKSLVAEGLALTEKRHEKRFQKLVTEYISAQETAKKNRLNMWRYGDITEDDAKEFGYPTK